MRLRRSVTVLSVAAVATAMLAVAVPGAAAAEPGDWSHRQEAGDPAAADGDEFGAAVAIDGDTMVVGSPLDDGAGTDRGAVNVYTRDPVTGTWSHQAELTDSGPDNHDTLGFSVDISGDIVVAGAPGDDRNGTDQGSAYVFSRNPATGAWTRITKINHPDPKDGDQFGYSVAISNHSIVVGAPYDDNPGTDCGSAHLYITDPGDGLTWVHQNEFFDTDVTSWDHYGYSVDISYDTVVVGAPEDHGAGEDRGIVYTWSRDYGHWVPRGDLADPAAGNHDRFGASVAIDAETVLVGAPGDGAATDQGSVHVFAKEPYGLGVMPYQTILTDPTPNDDDVFGSSVAIDGDTVVVGAYLDDGTGTDRGAGHLWTRDPDTGTWGNHLELNDPNAANNDVFGSSVSVAGNTIAVGAPADDGAGTGRGAAHVFERAPSTQQLMVDPTPGNADQLGFAVDVDADTLVIGAWGDNGGGVDRGAVHVYVRDPATGLWSHQVQLTDPAADNHDRFGWAVAVHGNNIAVGAPLDDGAGTSRGAVHVFSRDPATGTWTHRQELTHSDPVDLDYYGHSVAMDGETMAIGVPGDDIGGITDRGTIFVLDRQDNGVWHGGLMVGFSPEEGDGLGSSVSVSGDIIVAGAPDEAVGGNDRGTAHVWVRDPDTGGWGNPTELNAPVPGDDNAFGESVSVSGNTLVAGSVRDDTAGENRGAAHLFTRNPGTNDWAHQAALTNPSSTGFENFGTAVAIEGNTVAVGASTADGDGTNEGAVHVFTRDPVGRSLTHRGEARDPVPANDDWLGDAVAMHSDTMIAGAYGDDVGGSNRGVAMTFPLLGTCGGRIATHLTAHTGGKFTTGVGSQVLVGRDGPDDLDGGTGDDLLCGYGGDDTLLGQAGKDELWGGDGADQIGGGTWADTAYGGAGNDTIYGSTGPDILIGDEGRDTIWGGDGDDQIGGGSWGDTLHGEGGDDRIWGSYGHDVANGGDGDDRIWGGTHADELNGDGDRDRLYGNEGHDTLLGGSWPDVLIGHTGDDHLWGGGGNDTNYGGTGWDVCSNETTVTGCERIVM